MSRPTIKRSRKLLADAHVSYAEITNVISAILRSAPTRVMVVAHVRSITPGPRDFCFVRQLYKNAKREVKYYWLSRFFFFLLVQLIIDACLG